MMVILRKKQKKQKKKKDFEEIAAYNFLCYR